MEYKVIVKESFSVVGVDSTGSHTNPEDNGLIATLWERLSSRSEEVEMPLNLGVVTGICIPPASNDYYYIAGIEVEKDANVPEGMVKKTFPTLKYLVFTHRGTVETLFHTYGRIWNEWLPASGFQLSEGPELEIVDTSKCTNPFSDDYKMDIYIPVKKRID